MRYSFFLKFIALIVLGAVTAFICYGVATDWRWFRKMSTLPPTDTAFSEQGVLVRNTPGLTPNTWYLMYEKPGKPGLHIALEFSADSACMIGGLAAPCGDLDALSGQAVVVSGQVSDEVVHVEQLLAASTNDAIRVNSPALYDTVHTPLFVTGEARGSWYFEAQFPVSLFDSHGQMLAQSAARATGDWMTSDFVPFTAELMFSNPATATGLLVLENDNPSGLPQNSKKISIPVQFNTHTRTVQLYYYNPALDKDAGGNIQCSKDGLVPVARNIPWTITPIQDTIRLLLRGQLTDTERARGLTTEYPLNGFGLDGANLRDGVLVLAFHDTEHASGGGSCRVQILWQQIAVTAQQFPGVREVKFQPDDLFQP